MAWYTPPETTTNMVRDTLQDEQLSEETILEAASILSDGPAASKPVPRSSASAVVDVELADVVDRTQAAQKFEAIAVMGPTGSGKSTFISKLAPDQAVIGHDLSSCICTTIAFLASLGPTS